ncbi:16S rRNA (uracil(1498)-N(3))-methyltransferase [Irregularibacter muris]|uniref:Ribosomal RNA small subunit methyltransferase E n=1 Tax=Irregularibacter muris TaxID=1796619 RepID=A0AAE3HE83_9FIRM|nr:16S rRNA (uracil(1498)-N(3))-methyltransferase [Irregularibacter muris]MCR1897849.1 16S rRNA (uracil(1498)-N(3))-methyltransferase [Irregularibacter muris]
MHRFFVEPNQIEDINNRIIILGEDVKHIDKVLRLKEGEEIEVCDGRGTDYRAIIQQMKKDEVIAKVEEKFPSKGEPNIEVTLYQGLPKSTKMDFILQKCIELGIKKIVPLNTERTIVKLENEKAQQKKLERWQRIAYEAAKQSKRGSIPEITPVKDLKNIWQELSENDLNIIAYENEDTQKIRDLLTKENPWPKKIGVIIGPEGGFEEEEIRQAIDKKVLPVSLGSRILRTETAGIVALTILMYALGEI